MYMVIGFGFVIHTLGSSIPLWYHPVTSYQFVSEMACCSFYNSTGLPPEVKKPLKKAVEAFDYIGITIPIPIIIISFIVIIVQLRKNPISANGGGENNVAAAVTVTLFTGTVF